MPAYFAVTANAFDSSLLGFGSDVALRPLTSEEQVLIEDRFFIDTGVKVTLPLDSTVIAVPDKYLKSTSLEEFRAAVEFALAILCKSGFQAVKVAATLGESSCSAVTTLVEGPVPMAVYPDGISGKAICEWIAIVLQSRQKLKDRMHVTADRYIRYCRTPTTTDSLLDLCICLESLIGAENEISFRFSVCLAKLEGGDDPQELSEFLSVLYTVRSNVVHGADPTKAYKKLEPGLLKLHVAARTILAKYVLHLFSGSQDEWRKNLRSALLG